MHGQLKAIRTILAPTDFSKAGDDAVDYATRLAKRFDAHLVLLHVFDLPALVGTYHPQLRIPGGVDAEEFRSMGDTAALKVEARAEKARAVGVDVEARIVEGTPVIEINKAAKALNADLIIMGTHGRRGLDRWIIGSVAAAVMRHAPCPLITVPPAQESAKGEEGAHA